VLEINKRINHNNNWIKSYNPNWIYIIPKNNTNKLIKIINLFEIINFLINRNKKQDKINKLIRTEAYEINKDKNIYK